MALPSIGFVARVLVGCAMTSPALASLCISGDDSCSILEPIIGIGLMLWIVAVLGFRALGLYLGLTLAPVAFAIVGGLLGVAFFGKDSAGPMLGGLGGFLLSFKAMGSVIDRAAGKSPTVSPPPPEPPERPTRSAPSAATAVQPPLAPEPSALQQKPRVDPPKAAPNNQLAHRATQDRLIRIGRELPDEPGYLTFSGDSMIRFIVVHGDNLAATFNLFAAWAASDGISAWGQFTSHGFSEVKVLSAGSAVDGAEAAQLASVEFARWNRMKPGSARMWPPQ